VSGAISAGRGSEDTHTRNVHVGIALRHLLNEGNVIVEHTAQIAIGKLVEGTRTSESPTSVHHHDHKAEFCNGLQPQAPADRLWNEESLRTRIDVLDHRIFFPWIKICRPPDHPIDRSCTVSRCALKRLRKFPSFAE